MLQHCRKVLDHWTEETRENKLRTARELLVCSHSARTREDLVFKNWLTPYLQSLREFNQYGDFDDPELAIAVARSCVNISSSGMTIFKIVMLFNLLRPLLIIDTPSPSNNRRNTFVFCP
jgi:hypothetical protein